MKIKTLFFSCQEIFFVGGLRWRSPPLYPEILQYYTMILQRTYRIIVGDAGFETGTLRNIL